MAKKEKKISVSELEKAIGDVRPIQTEIEWNGLKILVNDMISLEDMSDFVNSVTASCFRTEDFSFIPEWKDFTTRVAVIDLYTNITLPRNPQKIYDILYNTQLFDAVVENINQGQFEDILRAINEKIRFHERNLTAIAGMQMVSLADSVQKLQSTLGSMVEGIGPDDLRTVVKALENGMDEQKLAQAVLQERSGGQESIA